MGIMNVPRCGTCRFGRMIPTDLSKRMCHGAPPVAFPLPLKDGRVTVQMTRPVVSVSDDACSLYRGKNATDMRHDDEILKTMQDHPDLGTRQ